MTRVQKLGGVAALINAAVATATLVVAFGLIGLESLTDSEKLVNLAINNPTPLIIQDGLKFVMAITSVALITALFDRLKSTAPNLLRIATLCGLLAVSCRHWGFWCCC